jgi:hypothetical protein
VAALAIHLLQTPVCVFRSKLKGVFGPSEAAEKVD